jgi:methylthioribose-1-phosphate isomerase
MSELQPVMWKNNKLILLDQSRLPQEEKYMEITRHEQLIDAIKRLAVRGAPAIGVAAAYGAVTAAQEIKTNNLEEFKSELKSITRRIGASRPTAVNLTWAVERLENIAENAADIPGLKQDLLKEATNIHHEQIESDLRMAGIGAKLLKKGDTVLTHCNTGALATAGSGTALGIIKQAYSTGMITHVIATETRPLLQGSRLTAYELKKNGIPFHLITDSTAGALMKQGKINAVITGADRIAANGDTANKIGTYTLAVLAKEHRIPFYVAAPMSTVDIKIESGVEIEIEERPSYEVTSFQGVISSPEGINVYNPAFDVTPHDYISAIITERGIIREPYWS